MNKYFCLSIHFYLASSVVYADTLLELTAAIPAFSNELLHNEIQGEIKNKSLSQDSMKLIKNISVLKNQLKSALKDDLSNGSVCSSVNVTDPKVKDKKVINHGWRIIGSVEVNAQEKKDSYKRLKNTLSDEEYDQFYSEIENISNKDQLKEALLRHTENMDDDQYMSYLSEMTMRLPYNKDKAAFDKDEQHVDSLYSMIQSNDIGGICGDIHFSTVLMGEATRGDDYEFYTASYMNKQSQHVYSFAVSKNDPSQAYVINYSNADKVENLNGVDSILVNSQGVSDNIGANLRIYKNSSKSQDGQSEHVATIPTPIGRYLNSVHLSQSQIDGLLNQNQGTVSQVSIENTKTKIVTQNGESKIIDIAQGVKIAHGNLQNTNADNTNIFSLMVYSKRQKNLDKAGTILDSKKIASESNLSISGNLIDKPNAANSDSKSYLMRFNYFNRYHKTLVRTEKFDVEASAGFNISSDFVTAKGQGVGDANFETQLGFKSKIDINPKMNFVIDARIDHAIGFKEQRKVFATSEYPSNIKMTQNVYSLNAKLNRKVGRGVASLDASYVKTQVGSAKQASMGYVIDSKYNGVQHMININYTQPDKGINLLALREQVGVGYGFRTKALEAGASINYSVDTATPFVGGQVKINLDKRKNKKNKSKSSF